MFCKSLNIVIIQILYCPALVFFLRFMINKKRLYHRDDFISCYICLIENVFNRDHSPLLILTQAISPSEKTWLYILIQAITLKRILNIYHLTSNHCWGVSVRAMWICYLLVIAAVSLATFVAFLMVLKTAGKSKF